MDKNNTYSGSKDTWLSRRSSPRLCFWLGLICGMLIVSLAGLGYIGYLYNGGQFDLRKKLDLTSTKAPMNTETVTTLSEGNDVIISNDDNVLGNKEAKLSLVVYTDFECQLCKIYHRNVKTFADSHPDKVRVSYKNFIFSQMHPQAQEAAQAALCAGKQGKYYQYADALFSNQKDLGSTYYEQLVSDLQLNKTDFDSCLNSEEIKDEIKADYIEAINLDIHGLPNTIVIYPDDTRKLIDGNVSVEFLESLLKEYL